MVGESRAYGLGGRICLRSGLTTRARGTLHATFRATPEILYVRIWAILAQGRDKLTLSARFLARRSSLRPERPSSPLVTSVKLLIPPHEQHRVIDRPPRRVME